MKKNSTYVFILFSCIIIGIILYFIYDNYNTPKIYLSLTTIPERLVHPWFYNNLQHLMNLNGNYIVLLNIPETFKATGEKYIIPKNILELQNKNLIINRVNEDYGPITKLFGALQNEDISDDSILLICDDDIHYYKDFVNLIHKEYKNDISKIYTYCTPTIEGFKGFMFQKRILKPILKVNKPESCFRIDDNFINEFINSNHLPIQTISYYGNEDKYNDYRKKFCNFDINIHDNHTPKWRELKSDNRYPMIQKCIRDYHKLN